MEPIRLQKYLSECGLLSRRAAEEAIERGLVKVNGALAPIGTKIDPDTDEVTYRGEVVKRQEEGTVVVMLNKPRGVLTSMSDDRGRVCVSELVQDVGVRVFPCGRLDFDSKGLLLLTNDGELANQLTHPRHHIPKTYHVRIEGRIGQEEIDQLQKPIRLDGYMTRPAEVSLVKTGAGYTVLSFTLHEGRNRQIRRLCAAAGLRVQQLQRVAIGPVSLGRLKTGMWKKLNYAQIEELRKYGK